MNMNNDQKRGFAKKRNEIIENTVLENTVKKVIGEISSNVQNQYKLIDLSKVPDHVNYSKVEKYLRSINIDITRKMFFSYLKDNLLPGGHEVKNTNFSYYTSEQVIYYIMVDMYKSILPLNKVKMLFNDILKPMIDDMGLKSTYEAMNEMINFMVNKFEEAVTSTIEEEQLRIKKTDLNLLEETDNEKKKAKQHMEHYTNLVTLNMAKGALDFYKNSPHTLLSEN